MPTEYSHCATPVSRLRLVAALSPLTQYPCDLPTCFFSVPDGRISHVAVYDRDGLYIHSSGRVKTNRMDASDPDFGPRTYRGASRIDGMTGTPGIWQIIDHPWYF